MLVVCGILFSDMHPSVGCSGILTIRWLSVGFYLAVCTLKRIMFSVVTM